jgi:hypothetical protein
MTENDILPLENPRRFHFEWVLPLFFRPRRTLKLATDENTPTWITPLLVLTVLALALALVAGPVRKQAALNGPSELPADFQYWSTQQQEQYFASQALKSGSLFVVVFPALTAVAQVWVGWFLLAAVLHLSLTLAGSRSTFTADLNLVGWASLPLALRMIIQGMAVLTTRTLISQPGLAGFTAADAAGAALFLRSLLVLVDIYAIWRVVLLIVGGRAVTGLSAGKVFFSTLVAVLIVWTLAALPAFVLGQFSGLSTIRPFFF